MTGWETAFRDRTDELARQTPARPPATIGEIWNAEWASNGLQTTIGVNAPFMDAYQELFDRTAEVTGADVPELARQRGLTFAKGGMAGRIDTLGKIVDSLPDQQQRLLQDYKDVNARARDKARRIQSEAEDVGAATYGLAGHATGFLAGMARQLVDPVNLAMAPVGATAPTIGAGKMAIAKWLGAEFAAGAATQAAQYPYIRTRREELGLPTGTFFEDVFQAGVGQAGFSGLLRGAGAAYRALRGKGGALPAGAEAVSPRDLDAAATLAERDALTDALAGSHPDGQEAVFKAGRALNGEGPLEGKASTVAALHSDYDGSQPIIRPDGSRLAARYAVVERRDLTVSHDLDGVANPAFPAELQPRDRERAASRLWVNENAARLEPELLGASPTAREGAPVVGADGIVESGNGRVLLLDAAYRDHPEKAAAYRAFLDAKGFDVDGMTQPVLVRIREGDLSLSQRKDFTEEANRSATAALSASERAAVDARALSEETLSLWKGGDLGTAENAPFIRRFSAEVLTAPERGAFMGEGGALSKEGAARIEAALVAKAWRREGIVKALAEERDDTSKSILKAMQGAAPLVSRLHSALDEGRVGRELDIVTPITDAFELVDRARRTGQKVGALLDQADLERGAVTDEVRAAAALFFRNADHTLPAAWDTIRDRIDWASAKVLTHEPGGLFGDEMKALDVLRMAAVSTENLSTLELGRALQVARTEIVAAPDRAAPDRAAPDRAVAKLPDDPNLKQAAALLDEAGGDIQMHLEADDTKAGKTRSARAVLDEIGETRRAAAELADCVGRTGGPLKEIDA